MSSYFFILFLIFSISSTDKPVISDISSIDILLFNIKYNNYVVVEIKAREFRKEDIGQIKLYMNYIDKEVKNITQNKTMGIIITKEVNEFVIRYIKEDNIAISTFDINVLEEVT